MTVFRLLFSLLLVAQPGDEPIIRTSFAQEARTVYFFGDGLPLRTQDGEQLVEARAIAIRANGLPVAATVTELTNLVLLEFDGKRWSLATPFIDHVTKTPQHDEVASRSGQTYFDNKGAVVAQRRFDAKGYTLIATERAVWEKRVADPNFETKALFEVNDETIRALAAIESGAVAIGTSDGLYLRSDDDAPFEKVFPTDQRYSWSPRNVAALAYDTQERLWFGCDQGAGVFDGESWTLFTGEEGLPYRHFTCVAPGEYGVIWFGTERGAIRFDGNRWAYYASLRWLPADYVYDIAVGPAGDAWIATKEGISHITRQ